MSDEDRVFFLGVGAQKAGTTWLHAYLNSLPGSDMGRLKEYHVWDGISVPQLADYDLRGKRLPLMRRVKSMVMGRLRDRPDRLVLRQSLQRDPEVYFAHFAGFLLRDGILRTGDFTPSNSALDEKTLVRIRDGFERLGIRVKAVFLMRDPLKRARSAIRMYHRDSLGAAEGRTQFQGVDMTADPDAALLSYLDTQDWRLRGDYPSIVTRLERVFPPEDLYLGFYETMFTDAEFDRLNAFLGTLPDKSFRDRVFNETGPSSSLPDHIFHQAMRKLALVYDWALYRWPEMQPHWTVPGEAAHD